jgi:malate synthase
MVHCTLRADGLLFPPTTPQALSIGSGPYFYLPKMESHLEARCAAGSICYAC